MKKLENKIALITGGNSGIGLATANLFLEQGAKVIITASSDASYDKAKKELGSRFDIVQTDVSKLSDLDRLYVHIQKNYSTLDIVFANAGVAKFSPTEQSDEAFFDLQFNTNVKGLYYTVAKAIPILKDGASVILNASVVASKGMAGASVYAGTKASVRSFARSWTAEIPVTKARFNVLSPGPIETPIYHKLGMSAEQLTGFSDFIVNSVPAKRFGTAEEMASVALFLASSDSSYICGAEIMADGGFGQV